MSRSTPSLLALLGLVAVAGYQNRGKISEMLSDARKGDQTTPHGARPAGQNQDEGGFLSEIGRMFGAGAAGTTLSSGIGDLVSRFRASGRSAPADSWVSTGANMPMDVSDLEEALGAETLDELVRKTGLSRAQLLTRLNTSLPDVVNRFTPQGRIPTEQEARSFD